MDSSPSPGYVGSMVGNLLREWRQRRNMSQLSLACEAEISTRHLSFLETGRSQPSRDMLLRLAEQLEVPLRERNGLLIAAGFAPAYTEKPLQDLGFARKAIDLVLASHEPYPALAMDRYFNMITANSAVAPQLGGVAPWLLAPPCNVLRLTLHPEGLASRILNLAEWREHLLSRLRRQIQVSADPKLSELLTELLAYPASESSGLQKPSLLVPLRLRSEQGILSFFSTTTVFGTPVEVTLSEMSIELLFPADEATAGLLRG